VGDVKDEIVPSMLMLFQLAFAGSISALMRCNIGNGIWDLSRRLKSPHLDHLPDFWARENAFAGISVPTFSCE
jgi:hypothetical protein